MYANLLGIFFSRVLILFNIFLTKRRVFFRFVDGECGSSSGDSTGQLELSGGEQPDESSPASIHETNNNSLLHEDLERRI